MSNNNSARSKKLGDLIKSARERAGRSPEECAEVINVSPDEYVKAEMGEFHISLPDLEALAIYLRIPMGYFWGTESLDDTLSRVDYDNLIQLRHRVIGVLLRQLRLRERRTQKELAEAIDIDRGLIRQYETGRVSIPFLHLEQLGQQLGVSIEYFADGKLGPLGRHEAEQKMRKLFHQLSPELQEFLLNPVNVTYLDTAWRLSEMDVEKLRLIAENLLDITL
jgi:transcriptional regulator with XRE-family HTH domain